MDSLETTSSIARESLREVLEYESELITNSELVFIEFNIQGFSDFIERIKQASKPIQIIILYMDKDKDFVKETIGYNPNIFTFNIQSGQVLELDKIISALKKINQRLNKKDIYCRIKREFLLKADSIICDAYIQLSDDKYVKIINRHEPYDENDIKKYTDKGIDFFYIKENDFKIFIHAMVKSLQSSSYQGLAIASDDSAIISLNCIEVVHEIISKTGISSQALALTNEAVNNTLKLVNKTSLEKMLKSIMGQGSYIGELSLLVNYISCAICKESEWSSQENFLRLSLASFFQNIALTTDDEAKIISRDDDNFKDLYHKKQKIIIEHPNKAVEIISSIKGLPLGVDKIIRNHHENYFGSGFPRSVDYTNLEPMSTIFIISLEIANKFLSDGVSRDRIIDLLIKMENEYIKGSFGKVIHSAKKAFAVPLITSEKRDFFNE